MSYYPDSRSVRAGNVHTLTLETPVAISKEPTDYNVLSNKPSINGIELIGNVSLEQLGIPEDIENVPREHLTQDQLNDIIGE